VIRRRKERIVRIGTLANASRGETLEMALLPASPNATADAAYMLRRERQLAPYIPSGVCLMVTGEADLATIAPCSGTRFAQPERRRSNRSPQFSAQK
jgi:hypothetical protein